MLITESKTSEHANKCSGCQPKEESQTSQSVPKGPPLELMTLICVMFGLLLDSLIGILEGGLLGRFQRFATPPSADSHYT